jgi:hypothetical protein
MEKIQNNDYLTKAQQHQKLYLEARAITLSKEAIRKRK